MLELLNKLLSKLPFNGKKTATGVIISAVIYFYPDFPLTTEHLDKLLEYAGYFYLTVGLLHKWIKAKIFA